MIKALVIVDVQKGFINDYTKEIPLKIKELCDRVKFDNIITTQYYNYNESPFENIMGWTDMKDKRSIDIHGSIKDIKAYNIFKKSYTSFNNEFEEYIRAEKITEIIIVGVDTDACVLKTAVDAFERGIKPYVVEDLCGSSGGKDYHDMGIKIIKRTIGRDQVILNDYKKIEEILRG